MGELCEDKKKFFSTETEKLFLSFFINITFFKKKENRKKLKKKENNNLLRKKRKEIKRGIKKRKWEIDQECLSVREFPPVSWVVQVENIVLWMIKVLKLGE